MKKNMYFLMEFEVNGTVPHQVSFIDGSGVTHKLLISKELALAVDEFIRLERNQQRQFERHIEHRELTEEELHQRMRFKPKPPEDSILLHLEVKHLESVLEQLTDCERRRFKLRHYYGLKLREIAAIERCSVASAAESVNRAESKIRNALRNDKPP